jgi:AcrR family transcriptional regulator
LIDAAAQVIAEKGWERTSLEEVAQRAGMTRGAIYGNFKDRDELFLAVVRTRWKPVVPAYAPGTTFKQHMRNVGKAVAAATPARRAQALAAFSFMMYALTHDEMRAHVEQLNREIYRQMAERMATMFPGHELPMSAEKLVPVLHALSDGLTFLRFLTPELVTDDVVVAAFEALAE